MLETKIERGEGEKHEPVSGGGGEARKKESIAVWPNGPVDAANCGRKKIGGKKVALRSKGSSKGRASQQSSR